MGTGDPVSPKSNRELSWAETGIDAAKSLGTGLGEGIIGLAGLPGDVADLANKGLTAVAGPEAGNAAKLAIGAATNPLGALVNPLLGKPANDGSEAIRSKVEDVTGKFYEPKTTVGDYARTVGEMAPNAVGGGGGLVRKAAMVAVPAIASETAGKLTEGSAAEPYARTIAAVATGAPLAGSKRLTTNKMLRDASKTSKVMQQAKDDAYKLAEDTVGKEQVSLKEFADIVRGMNKEAVAKGVGGALAETTDKLYASSKSIISDMTKIFKGAARGERPPPTYGELEKFRQTLNDVVEGSKDVAGKMSADGYLASRFIDKLDDAIDKTPFQEARNAYKVLRKTQRIERAIATAETRSSSTDLAYKNEFKKIVRENLKRPLFSKAEMEAIRQVAGHGRINNLLEGLGRGGFSSKSSMAGTASTIAGGVLGPAIGLDPFTGAMAAAAVTSGAKKIGTKMTKTAAERARNIVSQGGDNAALDAKLTSENSNRAVRRTVATANASQQGNDGKRKPLKLKNGSIYWNPSPGEYKRLIATGEATAF